VVHLKNNLVHDRKMPRPKTELLCSQRGGRYLWSHTAVRRSTREAGKIKESLEQTKAWLLKAADGDSSFLADQVGSVFGSLAALVDRGELTGALHCTAVRCAALHCTALRCAALHCSALRCAALSSLAAVGQVLSTLMPTQSTQMAYVQSTTAFS
jgi:hypothetical protein